MREEVHLHRKAVENLSSGFLSTYLLHASFFGGVQLILNRGSMYVRIIPEGHELPIDFQQR